MRLLKHDPVGLTTLANREVTYVKGEGWMIEGDLRIYTALEINERILSQIEVLRLYSDDDLTGFLEASP